VFLHSLFSIQKRFLSFSPPQACFTCSCLVLVVHFLASSVSINLHCPFSSLPLTLCLCFLFLFFCTRPKAAHTILFSVFEPSLPPDPAQPLKSRQSSRFPFIELCFSQNFCCPSALALPLVSPTFHDGENPPLARRILGS